MIRKVALLIIAITSLSYSQNLFISDSLKQSSNTSDIWNIQGGFRVDEWTITGIDTGSTYTDSIAVYQGFVRKQKYTGSKVDTIWSRVYLDSAGAITSIIANPNSNTTYIPKIPAPQLLKLEFLNAESVSNRRWSYIITGWGNK